MTRWLVKLTARVPVCSLIEVEASDKEAAKAEALRKVGSADWEPVEAPDADDCFIAWVDAR